MNLINISDKQLNDQKFNPNLIPLNPILIKTKIVVVSLIKT